MRIVKSNRQAPAGAPVSPADWDRLVGSGERVTLDVEPGSLEWKLARSAHFTASELPGMARESKWVPRTPRDVLRVKRGDLVVRDNPAMARGRSLEGIARRMVENALCVELPATTIRMGNLLASLDGWNEEQRVLVEIKAPMSAVEFSTEVPAHYWGQLCQQAVVSGARRVLYAEYIGGLVQAVEVDPAVLRDSFERHYAPILLENLSHLTEGTLPPAEGPQTRNDEAFRDAVARYIECKHLSEEVTVMLESARLALIELAGDDGAEGYGLKVQYVERPGNVNWNAKEIVAALAAASVNPNDYRGKPIRSARITTSEDSGA